MDTHLGFQSFAKLAPGLFEVEVRLETHPEGFGDSKIASQSQGGIGGNSPLGVNDLVYVPWRPGIFSNWAQPNYGLTR